MFNSFVLFQRRGLQNIACAESKVSLILHGKETRLSNASQIELKFVVRALSGCGAFRGTLQCKLREPKWKR